MKRLITIALLLVVLTALSAGAVDGAVGVRPVSYAPAMMKKALKAIGYPRTHLRKLTCRGVGAPVNGRYWSFRCAARWSHRGRRAFYAAGSGYGGWLCVGSSSSGCKVLRRGYLTEGVGQAAVGFMQNHFGFVDPERWTGTCSPPAGTASNVEVFCFANGAATAPLEVGISLSGARGGGSTMVGSVLSGG
jgi:hypothetical protein